jgi:hypothetical protein
MKPNTVTFGAFISLLRLVMISLYANIYDAIFLSVVQMANEKN